MIFVLYICLKNQLFIYHFFFQNQTLSVVRTLTTASDVLGCQAEIVIASSANIVIYFTQTSTLTNVSKLQIFVPSVIMISHLAQSCAMSVIWIQYGKFVNQSHQQIKLMHHSV